MASEVTPKTVAMTMKTTLLALGLPEATTDAERLAALRPYRDATERILALTGKPAASEPLGTVEPWTGPPTHPAPPAGIGPATFGLGNRCSIH